MAYIRRGNTRKITDKIDIRKVDEDLEEDEMKRKMFEQAIK